MIYKKGGFTLVELIVVISILAVLATIWYISYSGYISAARDATRIHNISIIERAIEYHREEEPKLFLPENNIAITLSWTVVWYQGNLWKTSLWKIWITQWWTDPLDWEYYSYFLSGNKAQVLTFLENPKENSVDIALATTFAATDYSDRYPYFKWSALWMILAADNTPIHRDIDVVNAWEFDIFNPIFSVKYIKSLYSNDTLVSLPALMIGWQLSLNSKVATTNECPINFIPVPGNKELWQPDFCIWKYEASTPWNVKTLAYETKLWVLPITDMWQTSGTFYPDCRGNGPNYHIMTMMEWLTIARNLEQVDFNWSNGRVWSGHVIWWNNGNNITGFNSWILLQTWPSWNTSDDNKRQLILSNWEIIWDFVWNAWEIVKSLNLYIIPATEKSEILTAKNDPTHIYATAMELFSIVWINSTTAYHWWSEITDMNFKGMFWPKTTEDKEQWIWAVRQFSTRSLTLVWWDYIEGSAYENGLYSMFRLNNNNAVNIWTRCAYSY